MSHRNEEPWLSAIANDPRTEEQQRADYYREIAALKEPRRNTDREIWRGPDDGTGSAYAGSLFITEGGALGINCGGMVHVRSIRDWHKLVGGAMMGSPVNHMPGGMESHQQDVLAALEKAVAANTGG